MIIPPDALRQLQAVPETITLESQHVIPVAAVYGVYVLRHGARVLNAWRHTNGGYVGMSLTMFPKMLSRAKKQVIARVSGVGFGCTLIRRFALEKVDFHPARSGHPVPDVPFAEDCIRNGWAQLAHFGVECGHICPDGTVLWPRNREDHTDYFMRKVMVLKTFNGMVEGKLTHFEQGMIVSIPEVNAMEYVRAGFLKFTEPRKEPKELEPIDKTNPLNRPVTAAAAGLAEEHGIQLAEIPGDGKILKGDVQAFLEGGV